MQVTVHCIDLMTSEPVEECEVTCEATVAPRFRVPTPRQDRGESDQPVLTLLADDDRPDTIPDEHLERGPGTTLPAQQATTGRDGVVSFVFDIGSEYERIQAEHVGRSDFYDAVVLLAHSGRVDGLERSSPRLLSTTSSRVPDGNVSLERIVFVDFAKAIVGHTTGSVARLWFQLHGDLLSGRRYDCEIDEESATPSDRPRQVLPIVFDGSAANTAVVDVTGLVPDRMYRYQLLLRPEGSTTPRTGRPLIVGGFRTASADARDLTFYFGSCHYPLDTPDYHPLSDLYHWRHLARRDDADLLLLLGDQIYGDEITPPAGGQRWFDAYVRRYNAFWTFQPLRDTLGRVPTYMVPDDHDVTDDWGTDDSLDPQRIDDATEAIRIFQLAHSPSGRSGPFHYHFRRGPVAIYMTDGRTDRGHHADAPVLGRQQWDALEQWSTSSEAIDADVIVLGCSVPPALLPLEQLEDAAEALAVGGGAGGVGLLGAAIGAAVGGPVGAGIGFGIGALVGGAGADIVYEAYDEEAATEFDAADAWTWQDNQPDLERLLDLAFGLANDTIGSRRGQQPRLVVILGGDAHFGFMHSISSDHADDDGTDHRRNPQVLQLASSAIGRNALDRADMRFLVDEFGGEFTLDSEQGDHYRAEKLGVLWERTLGRLRIERVGADRTYQVHATVEGETDSLTQLFSVDLDASRVRWNDLIGQVLATHGVPTLLRVHEVGDSVGGGIDRLQDVDVVFQLDGEPGRWFGFPLRPGPDEPAFRGMLDVLRTAFNAEAPVHLDYRRTGLRNGLAIRVTAHG